MPGNTPPHTVFLENRPPRHTVVSVLFTRSDSCYTELPDVDCWDIHRDARSYTGLAPVICHPPCRGWGRLRHWSKPRPDEKALALFSVETVRRVGGVLEHPYGSTLWPAACLPPPQPGATDAWGGFTLLVDQGWWGHPAPKPTYLYIVGVTPAQVPPLPVQLHRAAGRTLELSPADRERTPPLFASWLLQLARRVSYTDQVALHAPYPVTPTAGNYRPVSAGVILPVTPTRQRAAGKRAALREWAAKL